MPHDRASPTRMPTQNTSHIVYVAINNNPAVIWRVMIFNFLSGEFFLRGGRFALDIFDLFFRGLLHPAVHAVAGIDRVTEEEICFGICFLNFWADLVPAIVHHSAYISRVDMCIGHLREKFTL